MAADEPAVPSHAPMPPGYCFVPKGNVYITAHCRKATVAAGQPVYAVVAAGGGAVLGLRCPRPVHRAVCAAEAASRGARAAATARRDAVLDDAFRAALVARYAAVPADQVAAIVRHAMAKHQGRVARTATLDLAARVRLAVRAHIRHRHTAYEPLLRAALGGRRKKTKNAKDDKMRDAVRAQIVAQVDAIERAWAGKPCVDDKGDETRTRTMNRTEGKAPAATTDKTTQTDRTAGGRVQKPQRASKREAIARIARMGETIDID